MKKSNDYRIKYLRNLILMPEADMKSTTLTRNGIKYIYHVAPLHYLNFYIRYRQLLSKAKLIDNGFDHYHFRSSTRRVDTARGFDSFIHFSKDSFPPLLKSMIKKGYQHMVIAINSDIVNEDDIYLCKYNVGRNRGVFTESLSTGRCFDNFRLPVAKTVTEKDAMLSAIQPDQYIEILVKNSMDIPESAKFYFLNTEDADIAHTYFKKMHANWKIQVIDHSLNYHVEASQKELVLNFLERSFEDSRWKGNGLEFDR